MKIKCYNIEWDTDGDKKILKKLPKEVIVNLEDYDDEMDLDEQLADIISDEFGFCIFGFEYEIIG